MAVNDQSKDLKERLLYDGDKDFIKLAKEYLVNDQHDYVRNSKELFSIVRKKDTRYINHGPVLALSFGGSNTKLMIASTKTGHLLVHHLKVFKNPDRMTHFYNFLDKLILEDNIIYKYITEKENPMLSVSLPVMIGQDENNLNNFFRKRNLKSPKIYFQPDPIAAHIGGISQIELKENEKSILLVCGTGMAAADDNTSRVISRLTILDHDEELYPRKETEGYVYESGCGAGMFFHGSMNRAIKIREREKNSPISGYNLSDYFTTPDDSMAICKIWETTFRNDVNEKKVLKIKKKVSAEAFKDLQEIANLLMKRVYGSLANAVIATAVKMNKECCFNKYHVIFEGSVALNKYTLTMIIKEIEKRIKNKILFDYLNVEVPELDVKPRKRKEIFYFNSIDDEIKQELDISLIGTTILGITADISVEGEV